MSFFRRCEREKTGREQDEMNNVAPARLQTPTAEKHQNTCCSDGRSASSLAGELAELPQKTARASAGTLGFRFMAPLGGCL